ncbi:unnamed protein product [Sphagnum balticum]
MQQEGVQPNSVTFVGVLNACASMVALDEGRCVHQQIIQSGLELDVFVGNSLVHMYAKCESMEDACSVFNKMLSWNVVTWTAILGGCAMHGHEYMISATSEYYTCMVDLLGHTGHLQEAENMVMAMPYQPHAGCLDGLAQCLQNSWMSSGIVAQSKFNTVIRYGATKKVAKEPPWSFGFLHLPFLPLRSAASFVDSVCMELFWKVSGCGDFSFCNQNHDFFMDSGKWPWWLLCASAGRSSR